MRQLLFLFVIVILFSSSLQAQHKLSSRQQMFDVWVGKYQDAVSKAPDDSSRMKILSDMWRKHVLFIQDTLKFIPYPKSNFDTFYFKKVSVKKIVDGQKKLLNVTLDNGVYRSWTTYDITSSHNIGSEPLYKMLMNLKQDTPVLALIHLQDFTISNQDVGNSFKRLWLVVDLKAVCNLD